MARQTRTSAQITQVNNDFDVFEPVISDASLNMSDRTVYLTTDPTVDLSSANVLYVKDYTQFRGTWSATPTTGGVAIPYAQGDIVTASDDHLYQLDTVANGTTDPATDSTGWTQLSHVDALGAREFSTSDTYETNNLVYRNTGAGARDLFVFINASSTTGALAPLPTVGNATDAAGNWRQVGGSGLTIDGDAGITTIDFNDTDFDVTDGTNATTDRNVRIREGLQDLPAAVPSTASTRYQLNVDSTGNTRTWELDNIPQVPTGSNRNYHINVDNGVITWTEDVPSSRADNTFVFEDAADLRDTRLDQYRDRTGTLHDVRSVNLVRNAEGGQDFNITLAHFSPTFSFGSITPRTLAWDQAWESTDSVTVNVNNPGDFTSRYISSVRAIFFDEDPTAPNTGVPTFTAGTQSETPAGGVDWSQSFTGLSPILATPGEASSSKGFDFRFNSTDNGTESAYTGLELNQGGFITWAAANEGITATPMLPTDVNFWDSYTTFPIAYNIPTSTISTESNILNLVLTAGTGNDLFDASTLGNIATPGRTGTHNISAAPNTVLYKDSALDNSNVTVAFNLRRPAGVSNLTTMEDIVTTVGVINYIPDHSFNTPGIKIAYPNRATWGTTPTAYGTNGILTGDHSVGSLALASNASAFDSSQIIETSVPAGGAFFWYGVEGSIAPTILFESAINSNQFYPLADTRTQTIEFSTTTLASANVPSGWTTVTYTFTGFLLNAEGNHRIRIT